MAQPGIMQPCPQSPLVALGGFAVEQQAEPFGMREIGALRVGPQLGKARAIPASPSWCIWSRVGWVSKVGLLNGSSGSRGCWDGWDQLALPCWLRRSSVEPVLEDRLDRAIRTGADVETAIAGRFQPLGTVLSGEPENAEASAVAYSG